MSVREDLEVSIRDIREIVQEYEHIARLSADPKEKARSRQAIQEQEQYIQKYLQQYVALCDGLDQPPARDIMEIAIHYGVPFSGERPSDEPRETPSALPSTKFTVADAHALLIGVGHYLHPRFRSLPATIRDAQLLREVLIDPKRCGYLPAKVDLVTREEATAEEIRQRLSSLSSVTTPDSTVFVYFSGHGGRWWDGKEWQTYLCPREADPDDLPGTAIAGTDFSDLLASIQAKRMLVILDACRAGGSADLKAADGGLKWKAGLSAAYYERLTEGSGRVVIASCREDQLSYVRPQGDLSLFTWYLHQGLAGSAAIRGDGLVYVLDLYHYVSGAVQSDEPKQSPVLKVKDMDLSFPIALAQDLE
jgi:hypothetical protein